MRKVLLLLTALVLPMVASAPLQADEYEYLWLYSPAPSEPQSYAIADLQKITFGEEALQVLWAAKKFNPDKFADVDIEKETKDFYMQYYGYQLTDDECSRILNGENLA